MGPKNLVLGIGNVLMGDEGVGVRIAEALFGAELPPEVEVVEGGTGGFQLLGLFDQFDRIVIVDAALDGKPPGTLSVLAPKYSAQFPPTLTAHDIGLKDLVDAAELLGHTPEIRLVTISIADLQNMGLVLSLAVEAAVPRAVEQVFQVLKEWEPSLDFSGSSRRAERIATREARHA